MEQATEGGNRFRFGKRDDVAMGAVHFDLAGAMQKSDSNMLADPIAQQLHKPVTRFVFHLARLTHMHQELVGVLVFLHGELQTQAGIIILVGVNTDSLRMLHTSLREGMFSFFQFAGDEEGARRILGQHKAASEAETR